MLPVPPLKANIIIADDHPLFRKSVSDLFRRNQKKVAAIHHAATGLQVLSILKSNPVDVIFLDVRMPEMDGEKCMETISIRYPAVKVIVISQVSNPATIRRFIALGVWGYILKMSDGTQVQSAFKAVMAGNKYFDPFTRSILNGKVPVVHAGEKKLAEFNLTTREIEIIRHVALRKTSGQISVILHLSVDTVNTHRRNIREKTSCSDVIDLCRFALRFGIISIDEFLFDKE